MRFEKMDCVKNIYEILFEKNYVNTMGIFWTEEAIFLAALKFQKAKAIIEKLVCLPCSTINEKVSFIAEQIQKAAETEGLPYSQSIICLAENKVVSLQKEFPVMEQKELSEAIKWEIEDIFSFSEESAAYGFCKIEENNAEVFVEIQAVELSRLEELLNAFRENDITVLGLVRQQTGFQKDCSENHLQLDFKLWSQVFQFNETTVSPDFFLDTGFFAALQAACYPKKREQMINILPQGESESCFCWSRLYGGIVLLWFFCVLGLYLQGCFQLQTLSRLQEDQVAELALLRKSEEKREALISKQEKIEQKNHILENLSTQRIYGQSILVHLGLLPIGKVRLTGVEIRDDHGFIISGEAENYMALSKFMGSIEDDDAFKKVQLINSEKKIIDTKENGLHFVLQVNFAELRHENEAD
jgi:hypothetical protein